METRNRFGTLNWVWNTGKVCGNVLFKMSTNYARKMAVLRARIFGELVRPTTVRYALFSSCSAAYLYILIFSSVGY